MLLGVVSGVGTSRDGYITCGWVVEGEEVAGVNVGHPTVTSGDFVA